MNCVHFFSLHFFCLVRTCSFLKRYVRGLLTGSAKIVREKKLASRKTWKSIMYMVLRSCHRVLQHVSRTATYRALQLLPFARDFWPPDGLPPAHPRHRALVRVPGYSLPTPFTTSMGHRHRKRKKSRSCHDETKCRHRRRQSRSSRLETSSHAPLRISQRCSWRKSIEAHAGSVHITSREFNRSDFTRIR